MKDNKHGFTLAELLVVIAIMMILAGVSFVGISSYIRNLHLVEMDNAAKEIFIVAQNHLSQAYASGEYMREDVSYYGTKFESKPNYLSVPDDAKAEYYYVVFKGYPAGNNKPGVLGTMLPQYSIEEEIADYGNYLIVYEKNSATVVSVFYSGRSHTYFGSSPVHEFVAGSAEVEGNGDEKLKAAVNIRENRKHYNGGENSVIGWYGSNGKKVVPSEAFNSIKLEITNGSRLTATVTNPNYTSEATNQKLNLIVRGLTSGKEKILSLENYSKVDWKGGVDCKFDSDCILDDITSLNSHFCNKFPEFTPGEDVEIYAELSDTSRFVAPIKSNVCVVNSLFESYSDNATGKKIAEINNIRHLENLDPNVSNLGVTVTKAEQLDDLVYGGSVLGTTSFAEDITGVSGNNGQAISIYSSDDAAINPLSDKGYYGIYNSKLQAYDGQNHSIINIYSVTGDSGNTGIFAETGASGFEFRNLTVKDSSFIGTQDSKNSGGLVGHSIGGLKIRNCNFQGDDSTISASGDAGAMVGLCDGALTVSNCEVKGARLIVNSTSGNAGGLAANCGNIVNIRNGHISGSGLCIVGSASNSGGIIGTATGAVTMEACSAAGEKLTVTGKNAGGMIGSSAGAVTMSSCSSIGKNAMISGENAGGIMGISNGGLNITNSYSSSFVFATANAGGFIGNILNGSENQIVNCYSSGHTKDKTYKNGKVKAADPDNFNVISDNVAGGFIGSSSVTTTIKNSYSTCSVYSSSGSASDGFAGGFIGRSSVTTVANCYSAGLVSIKSGGNAGGFVGQGAVSASTACYYLKGKGFNGSLKASAASGITNVSSTSGTDIIASGTTKDGFPWDSALKEEVDETIPNKYKAKYPFMTVKELYDKQPTDPAISVPENMKNHYGDWIPEVAASSVNLSISNAERLEAIITIPTSNLETAGDDFVSMTVEGMLSGKKAYAQLYLRTGSMAILGSDVALANIVAVEGNEKIADSGNILFLDALSYSIKTVSDDTEFHIYLDDITTAGGNFAKIFTDFIPGEDIRITAESGFLSWSTLIGDAIDYETAEGLGSEVKITGITNSLFASGSGKGNYTDKSYYSDIDPDKAIVDPVSGDKDAFKMPLKTALIGNFRHLQNLDKYISNVDNTYTKAKVYRNLYWNPSNELWKGSNATDTNGPKTGYKDFISAIGGSEVKIFAYDDIYNAVTSDNSFFGIINPNLQEFDGQNCSINNVVIRNSNSESSDSMSKDNPDAGIFRYLNPSNNILIKNVTINYISVNSDHGHAGGLIGSIKLNANTNTTINNVNISEPVVLTTSGHAGGLIGHVKANENNSSELKADYTYIYGEKALVRTLATDNHSAGGFIGAAENGAYTIKNCGASTYVYADTATCAGGFIGDFKPMATTNIEHCFVGGHVQDGTEVYINNQAVVGAGTEITNEGGFNVCGKAATGGFIGFIGTDKSTSFTFKNCFTTASVHAENGKSGPDSQSGATGGFIGRMQNKGQKYHNCYAAGKIFPGNSYAGAFVGHHINGAAADKPDYEDDYVLQGEGFNDDQGLKYVNFGSSEGYEISGISFAAYDSDGIKNKSGEYIVATTFNRTSNKQYPYRDTATDSVGHGLFYGDWVVPAKKEPLSLINGNRLTASIELRDETKGSEFHYNKYYDVTYIRVRTGVTGYDTIFRVLYNEDGIQGTQRCTLNMVQLQQIDPIYVKNDSFWENVYDYGLLSASMNGSKIDFYIDDISVPKGCYKQKVKSSTPGENITVYVGNSYEGENGVRFNSVLHVEGNSLFGYDPEENINTALISNSRNLENLDSQVSGLNVTKTKAKLTDDIYWEDDETKPYTASIDPYLTEIPNAHIYRNYVNNIFDYATPQKYMLPITKSEVLKEFDGGGHTIHGMKFSSDYSGNAGLFGEVKDSFAITDLWISNPTIAATQSAGSVIGVVSSNGAVSSELKIEKVYVNENVTVHGVDSGGLIGYADSGKLVLNHVGVVARSGNISNGTYYAYNGTVGGLIGKAAHPDLNINNCYTSAYVDGYGAVGGFIGSIANNTCTGTIQNSYVSGHTRNGSYSDSFDINDSGRYSVIGEANYAIGGFIGKADGNLVIKNCFSTNTAASFYDRNISNPYYIGCFAGALDGNVHVDNCYTIGYIKLRWPLNNYYGSFAGRVAGSAKVENSYYVSRGDNSWLSAIGDNSSSQMHTIYDDTSYYGYHFIGQLETNDLSTKTTHHDQTRVDSYPYKNWTNANDDSTPGATPVIEFYGDW